MTRRRATEDGFTLVEVLVAAFVLAAGVLAALTIFSSAQSTSKTSQRNEVAAREAEHQLELLRGQCYGALAMSSAHGAPSADLADPRRRITPAGTFTVKAGLEEEMVSTPADKASGDGCTDADGDGKVEAAVAPVSAVTIGTGGSAITGTVYRFVSWRDEECPILNLTHLEGVVQDLKTLVTAIAGPSGTLTGLLGPTGALTNLVTNTATTVATGSTATALQKLLYPTIVTLTSTILSPALTGTLNPLVSELTPMLAPLQSALPQLSALLDQITQRIDLCDLPKLLDLSSIESLKSALTSLAPVISALQTPTANLSVAVSALVSLNLTSLLTASVTAVVTLPPLVTALTSAKANLETALNAVKDGAANGQTQVKTLAETMTTAISTLVSQPSTTHNTKRLTVAVWLDARQNSGLRAPFWASSVVSDPRDGLL